MSRIDRRKRMKHILKNTSKLSLIRTIQSDSFIITDESNYNENTIPVIKGLAKQLDIAMHIQQCYALSKKQLVELRNQLRKAAYYLTTAQYEDKDDKETTN